MRREKDRIGAMTAATVALAALLKWVSDLTAGATRGGRYDVPAVTWLAWFGFFVVGGVAVTLVAAGAVRLVERARDRRRRHAPVDEPAPVR